MLKLLVILIACFAAVPTSAATALHGISDVAIIPVPNLVNKIPRSDTDGRPSMIIINAGSKLEGGSSVYLVLAEDPSNVVPVDPKTGQPRPYNDWETVLISSDPPNPKGGLRVHAQDLARESSTTAVIFGHGRINGEPATLMLKGTKQAADTSIKSPVALEVYTLVSEPGLDMVTRSFNRVSHWITSERYCDPRFAVEKEFGLFGQKGSRAGSTDACR